MPVNILVKHLEVTTNGAIEIVVFKPTLHYITGPTEAKSLTDAIQVRSNKLFV